MSWIAFFEAYRRTRLKRCFLSAVAGRTGKNQTKKAQGSNNFFQFDRDSGIILVDVLPVNLCAFAVMEFAYVKNIIKNE